MRKTIKDLPEYERPREKLLQKGPNIQGPIWVVTKNGHIKPSNQVFLGTSFSPKEDWEKELVTLGGGRSVCTPHIGAQTQECQRLESVMVAEDIIRLLGR